MKNPILHYDIIIVGSGIVGSTAALLLAENKSLKIAIIDAQKNTLEWKHTQYDSRVSAISLASERIFHRLKVWQKIILKRISPYLDMHVWNATGNGKIHFNCQEVREAALGYIIEDNVMRTSLWEAFAAHSNIDFLHPLQLISLQKKSQAIELVSDDHQILSATLVIAADGAHSWVRDQVSIDLTIRDYANIAIATTVKTTNPHQATAWQCFLPRGPLAFLPLSDQHTSSIVWSTSPQHAEELLAMNKQQFADTLAENFGFTLGKITDVESLSHFPLKMRHANHYIQKNIALIGDAAHTIHPMIGQGVNLGLLDAAALAETIHTAIQKNRDFASFQTLRRFERWRKSDNLSMITMIDLLKFLFTENHTTSKFSNLSLNFTNRMPLLKKFFVEYALGNRGDLPLIATKEILCD